MSQCGCEVHIYVFVVDHTSGCADVSRNGGVRQTLAERQGILMGQRWCMSDAGICADHQRNGY